MRIYLLLSTAALWGVALAQFDYALLATFPSCAEQCASTVIFPVCNLTDLQSCFCKSHSLQYDTATCAIRACNVTEQYASLTILQSVCKGVPAPSRQAEVRRAIIILAAFGYPIIVLRFISRIVIARKVWWDDWLILACVFLTIPMTVLPIYPACSLGLGKHFYNLPPANIIALLKIFYSLQLFYVAIQTLAKLSILLLYLRIFPSQRLRLILKIAMVFMVCHGIGFLSAAAFQCLPVRSSWDPEIPGKCVDSQALIYAGAGFNIFEDLAIIFLPISELKGLKLSRRKRFAIGFMFALGSFACITSIIRIQFIASYGRTVDPTWTQVDVALWSLIEAYTAVICGCSMCIQPLITKYMPKLFLATADSDSNRDKGRGQKLGCDQSSRKIGGSVEMSGEHRSDQDSQVRSQINLTTESRFFLKTEAASECMQQNRDLEDNETLWFGEA